MNTRIINATLQAFGLGRSRIIDGNIISETPNGVLNISYDEIEDTLTISLVNGASDGPKIEIFNVSLLSYGTLIEVMRSLAI